MKSGLRIVVAVVAVIVAGLILISPVFFTGSGDRTVEADSRIDDLRTSMTIDDHGTLHATETAVVESRVERHGIFRYWDVSDAANPHVRYIPRDVTITRDGQSIPVKMSWEQGRSLRLAKAGDPDKTIPPGRYTYVLTYEVPGVLGSSGDPGSSRFLWRVVANGWQLPIGQTESTVTFPAAVSNAACESDSGLACSASVTGQNRVTVSTGSLPAWTGVSLRADTAIRPPDRDTLPWSAKWDQVLGRSVWQLAAVAIVTVAAATAALIFFRKSREEDPGAPVMYEPPLDPSTPGRLMSPEQTHFIEYEEISDHALQSTLFYLAERKLVLIQWHDNSAFTVLGGNDMNAWNALDPISAALARAIGVYGGGRFDADRSERAGKTFKNAQSEMRKAAGEWGATSHTVVRSPGEATARLAAILCWPFVIFVGLFTATGNLNSFVPYTFALLPFYGYAVAGLPLIGSNAQTRRVGVGREAWARAAGFERMLSTDSAKDRFDFSSRAELFTEYIPYAIAFDCADKWARKFRNATGRDAVTPVWLGTGGLWGVQGVGAMNAMSTSISASLSAYSASRSRSSSGGFGGGGGGGGGGTW